MSAFAARGVSAVLLDIEGTTTPMAFVSDVLFPYARTHLHDWIHQHQHSPAFAALVASLRAEHRQALSTDPGVPAWHDDAPEIAIEQFARWLMDHDRKSHGLKRLQGLIWERGYQAGVLKGEVFPDVAPAIQRWHRAGLTVAIYSSGSELAQRRLFQSTMYGDLTPYIAAFFDTSVGPKREPSSYRRIASALGRSPREILFVSDVADELSAAEAARLQVIMSVRPGNQRGEVREFERMTSFDELA